MQVTNYVNLTSAISANDFYCLIVGSNDYFDILAGANATVSDVVGRIQQTAATLYGSGVRRYGLFSGSSTVHFTYSGYGWPV